MKIQRNELVKESLKMAAIIIATLATLVSAPAKFQHVFEHFPMFRVLRNPDNTLTFEDPISGKWFINTTKVQNMDDDGVTVTATTANSIYSFHRCAAVSPNPHISSELKPNEFWKVVKTAYELHDERPDWAKDCAIMPDGAYMVKIWIANFYKDELDALNDIADMKATMACTDSEEIDFANAHGYLGVVGKFKVSFDEEFLERARYWEKRIFSYNEFAFDLRRRDRKEMREELAPTYLDKKERRNRLDYLRWYCGAR